MNSASQESELKSEAASPEGTPPTKPRPKNTRPPLPEDYKALCGLCRAGKLFAVQEWFKSHKYREPERYDSRHWPIGIAIEKGFHSLAEVLLQNGIPADGGVLQRAAEYRNRDMVELMFQYGAKADSVDFEHIVWIGERDIIRMFIERGADLITNYPIAKGLIRQTRAFLGIYKSNIEKHPELQFQADMALRHFCEEGSLRGVSLLMWLGANPRAQVPSHESNDMEYLESPMVAAAWNGKLDIIKRLKPDPALDDVNELLRKSISRCDMGLVKFWLALGADLNHVSADGHTMHRDVMWRMDYLLDPKSFWYGRDHTDMKRFATEWFSAGAKWHLLGKDASTIRKGLSRLSYMETYEFIKLLIEKQVLSIDEIGEVLDTPKLREHLKERRTAIAALVPRLKKWVKTEERKQQLERREQNARRKEYSRPPLPPPVERRAVWNDPRNIRRLSDE